jgi:four helix bundle protein
MARPKNYRDLIVWQKAMAMDRLTYALTQGLPRSEAYGLLSQIRRAAVSVPSNIAESHGRMTDSQFRYFLGNARGSLCELQTQLELASDLGYLDRNLALQAIEQGTEVARLINGLVSAMTRSRVASVVRTRADNPEDAG